MDCTSLEFNQKKKKKNTQRHTILLNSAQQAPHSSFYFPTWHLNFSSALVNIHKHQASPLSFKSKRNTFVLHVKCLGVIH